ncbi:MAG: filamentous hemagglutinin N-terminal domain-containing protein [Alphaproteobacteria bacterium]
MANDPVVVSPAPTPVPSASVKDVVPTLPSGADIKAGDIRIHNETPTHMLIHQTSDKGAIHWEDFSVGKGTHVQFKQPGPSSTTLNKVVGHKLSDIAGKITANGKIILVNPNGIVFQDGSVIDVNGLMATVQDIDTKSFMEGKFVFKQNALTDAGIILREGSHITVADRGLACFISPYFHNSGHVVAKTGEVLILGAPEVSLDFYGDGLTKFHLEGGLEKSKLEQGNTGIIDVGDGRVVMQVQTAEKVIESTINVGGKIQANGITEKGGKITLEGDKTNITVSATLEATGSKGGDIQVLSRADLKLTDTVNLDASGTKGGGQIRVGATNFFGKGSAKNASNLTVSPGAMIKTNTTESGAGGSVVLFSEGHTQVGQTGATPTTLQAKALGETGTGGTIEVSGKTTLEFDQTMPFDVAAPQGGGNAYIDPGTLIIGTAADIGNFDTNTGTYIRASNTILDSWINTQLTNSNVYIATNSTSEPSTPGLNNNIIILPSAHINWTTNASLALVSQSAISHYGTITHTSGNGHLTFQLPSAASMLFAAGSTVNFGGTWAGTPGASNNTTANPYALIRVFSNDGVPPNVSSGATMNYYWYQTPETFSIPLGGGQHASSHITRSNFASYLLVYNSTQLYNALNTRGNVDVTGLFTQSVALGADIDFGNSLSAIEGHYGNGRGLGGPYGDASDAITNPWKSATGDDAVYNANFSGDNLQGGQYSLVNFVQSNDDNSGNSIIRGTGHNLGIFGNIGGAVIDNLIIDSSRILVFKSPSLVGFIAGRTYPASFLSNINIVPTSGPHTGIDGAGTTTTTMVVGGLIGTGDNFTYGGSVPTGDQIVIKNSRVDLEITMSASPSSPVYSGGILGETNTMPVLVKNCAVVPSGAWNINGTYAGGIIGQSSSNSTIQNSYSAQTVEATHPYGLVASIPSGTLTPTNAYSAGMLFTPPGSTLTPPNGLNYPGGSNPDNTYRLSPPGRGLLISNVGNFGFIVDSSFNPSNAGSKDWYMGTANAVITTNPISGSIATITTNSPALYAFNQPAPITAPSLPAYNPALDAGITGTTDLGRTMNIVVEPKTLALGATVVGARVIPNPIIAPNINPANVQTVSSAPIVPATRTCMMQGGAQVCQTNFKRQGL